MKKYIFIVFGCLFFAANYAYAATGFYPIPDPNLRQRLIDSFPTLMNNKGELDTTAAKGVSRDLWLDNLGITNADGLQFFQSAGILKLRNNKLTSIPQLKYMRGLRRIYLNANQITSIPNLSALYQLQDLSIINNKITSLLGKDIENRTKLESLACSGNNITALPDLSKLIKLTTLSVDHNPLTVLPDLSLNTTLLQLDIGNTDINSVPSLSALVILQKFNCDNTNISDLSGLENISSLTKLSAENCLLTSLPNFANKGSLTSVAINHNYLTFEDLLPLTSLNNFAVFSYAPQKDVSLPLHVDVRELSSYTYTLSIDASITTNQYTWFKNNIPVLPPNSTGNYILSPVFMGDTGLYNAEVRNPALPSLVLKSIQSKLIVRPCMEITMINLSVLSSDCRTGSLIDIDGTFVDGSVAPITYVVQSINPVKNIYGTTATQFSNILPGTYVLQAVDSRNCSATKPFLLEVDCEAAFSPNGDGIMDNYFISDAGTVQIYNTSKKLIKTFQAPGAWDGTTNEGGLADAGYYVIIINGVSSVGVSLMR